MYVHATGLTFDGPLVENERVSFISEFDKRTNKPKAVNVSRTTTAEVAPTHAAIITSIDDEPSVSLVDEIMESVSKELDDFKSSIKLETFQRARLAAQLRHAAAESLALRAAEECRLEQEAAEECRLAEEATKAAARAAAADARLAEKVRLAALSIKAEKFQRSRLEAQVKQMEMERMTMIAAKAAAEAEKARIAEEMRLADEAVKAKAAAEAEAARIAEEMRLAEEAAKAKALAEAEAARIAEEMRLAEEAAKAKAAAEAARIAEEIRIAEEAAKAAAEIEAARIAEEMRIAEEAAKAKLDECEAIELGFPSAAIMKKRLQPKSPEEEAVLMAKYGAMSLGEKAFAILTVSFLHLWGVLLFCCHLLIHLFLQQFQDLGMIDLNPDPNDPSRDMSKDDDDLE